MHERQNKLTDVSTHDMVARCNDLNQKVIDLQIKLRMKTKEVVYLRSKLDLINDLSTAPAIYARQV